MELGEGSGITESGCSLVRVPVIRMRDKFVCTIRTYVRNNGSLVSHSIYTSLRWLIHTTLAEYV